MSGIIAVAADPSKGVKTSSFTFDVIWRILHSSASKRPFKDDSEYLDSLNWYEVSWRNCYLNLRKCQRPTLEAIRELMIQHADSNHAYWKEYYQQDPSQIGPDEGLTVEQSLRRWQAWTQTAMIQVAEAIDKRLKMQ